MQRRKLALSLAPLLLLGCDSGATSSRGFRLPDGDTEAGQAAFQELGCNACHSVAGGEQVEADIEKEIDVLLGGKVYRVKSYGQLVTAVIHPSHDITRAYPKEEVSRDGESLMTNFNETMTVQQLIDLVAYLQSMYIEFQPDYEPYFP